MTQGRRAIEILSPETVTSPLIFTSPHSGRDYPVELMKNSRLDRHALRQSEDAYVDLLFDEAPRHGAPFLRALFPRAYVDVNRAREEIDPRMFADVVAKTVDSRSSRVIAGLGVIPRIVADGQDIYERKLYLADANKRLSTCYDPYHAALRELIDQAKSQFGCAIIIDCHSMPSAGGEPFRAGEPPIDFVLGDRFGVSCSSIISSAVEQFLSDRGHMITRNAPYAGGFVASSYGRPKDNVHVLQIEINRALYLNERKITRTEGFAQLREAMSGLMGELTLIRRDMLWTAQAAE